MLTIPDGKILAMGEVMLELAPVGDGLYARAFAGDTYNSAWHMAQLLGARRQMGYISRVGQDAISAAFLDQAAADGLDVSGVTRDAARTMGLYLIELNGVERAFHYWRSASAARGLADDPARLTQVLHGAGLIHLSGITLAIVSQDARNVLFDALIRARAAGTIISFDPNIRPRLWSGVDEVRETVARMLTITDIALPSLDDEAGIWGDASPADTIARMMSAGVGEVVVKDGAGPVAFCAGDDAGTLPTPQVAGIRDTTGAGDAFNAGYLAARVLGRSAHQAITAGQAMAAEVIRHFGARAPKDRVTESILS